MTGHPVNIRKLIGTGGKLSNGSSKDGNENEGRRKLNNDKDKDKDKHKDKVKDKNKIEQKDKEKDKEVEKEEVFKGTHMKGGNIYVYVASDNEEVKEAFVSFLDNYHPQIRG